MREIVMHSVVIYGADYDSVEDIHQTLAEALDFPGYYGKNLDALYDVLTDIDQPVSITIDLCDISNDEMLRYLERMIEVISDAVNENENIELEIIEP